MGERERERDKVRVRKRQKQREVGSEIERRIDSEESKRDKRSSSV